jgi:hypothetical protein
MKKPLVLLIALVLASAGLFFGARAFRARPPAGAATAAEPGGGGASPSKAASPSTPGTGTGSSAAADPSASGALTASSGEVNLAAPELGGHIELVTSEQDREDRAAVHLIDRGNPADSSWTAGAPGPQEIVIGFFNQQPAQVAAVVFNPNTHTVARWAKDVEVWTSVESASAGFVRAASLSLAHDDTDQTMTFPPVEARFVKIRILSVHGAADTAVGMGKLKVIEARAPGYTPLIVRNPALSALLGGTVAGMVAGAPAGSSAAASAAAPIESAPVSANACSAAPPVAQLPVHDGSASVLVLSRRDRNYPPLGYSAKDEGEKPATSIYGRIAFTRVAPGAATAAMLQPDAGFDTVVLSQVCDIKTSVPDSFKRALVNWVALGHKLIIHDSDLCDTTNTPDYSFLPFRFSTSNPGKRGAESEKLIVVEESTLGNSTANDRAFLDVAAWAGNRNELGDSNTVKTFDAHWCGHLVTRNVLNVNGFVESYAHYGRGLIIYDGFDYDQAGNAIYRRLATNELAQPFNPDGLTCGAPLADFVLTTETALRTQYMTPGRTYRYPVTVMANQGYKGKVQLTATLVPPDPTVTATVDQDAVDVTDLSNVQLTVTTTGASPVSDRTIAVRGVDAAGTSNVLCLRLAERSTGSLRVMTEFPRPAHPTKNLEIILDLSGSMKLPLGKTTRIATARRVLHDVVAKIPDDFHVGLRVYGHRFGSRHKETCTDSELVVPIQTIDRRRVLQMVDAKQPRGETPLVYSVLQSAADLKALGGGSVILITDGEESCGGDPAAAVRELKASGVDIDLQILGFTLSGMQVQQQLTEFARAAGGHYYSAQDGETLARALLMAAVDKMPFTVFDAAGREVARADTGSTGIELPPGDYKVVVRAADRELVAEHVTIPARGDAVIKVVVKNDRFELQR